MHTKIIRRRKNYELINKLKYLEENPVEDLNIYTYFEQRDDDGKITVACIGVCNDTLDNLEADIIIY